MGTEGQAKKKWCPFQNGRHGPVERPVAKGGKWDRCIASECMAWRWLKIKGKAVPSGEETVTISKDIGYCGLAGNPL